MARGLPLVDAALALDPRSAEAYHARATLYAAFAKAEAAQREDTTKSTDQAAAALHRVIELDPAAVDAYTDLGHLLYERAKRERERDKDPRALLAEAKQIVERGIALAPQSSDLRGELGVLWNEQAEYEVEHGVDARPALDKAIASFDAALKINPADGDTWNNLGLALQTRAFDHLQHGRLEGEQDLERAEQAYKKTLALGVDSKTLNNLGFLAIDHATHLVAMDKDPHAVVEQGADYLKQALAANPGEENAYFNTATLYLIDSEYRSDRGIDPTSSLAATQAAIDADLHRSAKPDPALLAFRGSAHAIAGQWAMAHGQSPDAEFASAETALRQAERIDPIAYVIDARARLEKFRAEWAVSQHRDVADAIARAKTAARHLAEAVGEKAVRQYIADLALLEARSLATAKDSASTRRRAEAIATARRELEAAVADNPLLKTKLAPRLAELPAIQ
jgi:Tfp pilus assembly protein PilF